MIGTAIYGTGMYVPERRFTNLDFPASLETSDEWIQSRTGIVARRIAGPEETTSTMAAAAGADALKQAGLTPDDLDMVIVATCSADYQVPGSSPSVQAILGANRAGAMDINVGCSGFAYALGTASSLVQTGTLRNVLVCGAETLSRMTNWQDRTSCVLFGDGAGAVVVGPSDEAKIGKFVFGADASRIDALYVRSSTGPQPPASTSFAEADHYIHLKGQDIYKHACARMTEAALAVLGDNPIDSIDLLVAHQANARIISTVAERLGLRDEQVVYNLAEYGNTSAASIPITLASLDGDGKLQPGMRLLLVAFGAGFAWAAGRVTW